MFDVVVLVLSIIEMWLSDRSSSGAQLRQQESRTYIMVYAVGFSDTQLVVLCLVEGVAHPWVDVRPMAERQPV